MQAIALVKSNAPAINLRVGTPDDVDGVMGLAIAASKENGFVDSDPAEMLNDIWPALNLDAGIMGVIGVPGQAPEGAVLLRIGKMWYSKARVLEEKAIFVHPDFRSAKGGRASRLCEFSKHVSDKLELPLVIGVLSNARTDAKLRLYERHFGPPAGGFFLHNAKTGQGALVPAVAHG